MKRLELICQQAIECSLGPQNVVPILEGAHITQNERLFSQCRQYVAEHGLEVQARGGLDELQTLGMAKGLLADSIARCAHLQQENHRLQTRDFEYPY